MFDILKSIIMNITWYDKNNDIYTPEMAPTCQFLKKLTSFDLSHSKNIVNIIFSRPEFLNSFMKKAEGMSNIFEKLNIRIGCINNENQIDQIESSLIDSSVIFIGDDKHEIKYLNIFNNEACLISNNCHPSIQTIAYQRHLSQSFNANSISLSELRDDFSTAESKLRSAKSIFIKKNAVKKQDSGSIRSRITGLDIYEFCQIIRYAGLSESLDFLFINAQEESNNEDIWDFISTSLWYYLEGQTHINIDDKQENKKIYLLDCEFFEDPIVFIKSEVTNRWWFKHPYSEKEIPCSENDYNTLRIGQIPDLMSVQLFGNQEVTTEIT